MALLIAFVSTVLPLPVAPNAFTLSQVFCEDTACENEGYNDKKQLKKTKDFTIKALKKEIGFVLANNFA
jgi:hypothetical protein